MSEKLPRGHAYVRMRCKKTCGVDVQRDKTETVTLTYGREVKFITIDEVEENFW